MYGIKPFHSDDVEDEDGGPADIEASIEKELNDLQEKKKRPQDRTFSSVNTGIECVFFVKTRKPVDAAELTRRMCNDARSGDVPAGRRCKYINRLVPVMDVDKATEGGMERVGREILGREFELKKEDEEVKAEEEKKSEEEGCTVRYGLQACMNWAIGCEGMADQSPVRDPPQPSTQQGDGTSTGHRQGRRSRRSAAPQGQSRKAGQGDSCRSLPGTSLRGRTLQFRWRNILTDYPTDAMWYVCCGWKRVGGFEEVQLE